LHGVSVCFGELSFQGGFLMIGDYTWDCNGGNYAYYCKGDKNFSQSEGFRKSSDPPPRNLMD